LWAEFNIKNAPDDDYSSGARAAPVACSRRMPRLSSLAVALVLASVATLASPVRADEHGAGRDRYGNPKDLDAYIAAQEEPGRARWQKPDDVIKELAVRPGQTVCDIGAGPGYFSLRLARVVGERGRVYAVDVEPRILGALRDRLEKAGATNVTPVLGLGADPLLPPGACDLVLVVDTYHHFPDRPAYLKRLVRALAPAGRLANIDFKKSPTPIGPPLDHRVAREEFLADAAHAGLKLVAEPKFLENQYFVILAPR
jgi:SAM-dependent methyltransferase